MRTPGYLRAEIDQVRRKISYYRAMSYSPLCPGQKMYYQNLLLWEVDHLLSLVDHLQSNLMPRPGVKPSQPSFQASLQMSADRSSNRQKVFTRAELAQYDGAEGRPAYVAVNGIVYDLSLEPTWGGGTHFSLYAGQDLTPQFQGCHQGMEAILRRLPQVGVLQS